MIKNFLVLLLCLGLCGCASFQCREIYNNALKTRTIITITKEENYQQLKQKVAGRLEAQGYKNIIFEDQKEGFFVFAKEGDFGLPCQIIIKYTQKAGVDKIRVDMMKGSDELVTDSGVTSDMQRIAGQIKDE